MTEITGITGYTYDKNRFPQYYDGSKNLYNDNTMYYKMPPALDVDTPEDYNKMKNG